MAHAKNNKVIGMYQEIDMLVLTRKEDQAIFIGKDITVKVLSVFGNQVRIGIDARQEVQIHRDDIKNKRPKPIKVAV